MESGKFETPQLTAIDSTVSEIMPKEQWHRLLVEEVNLAHETGKPLSVIFIDIDNLKGTNDTFGHVEGDHIIDNLKYTVNLVQNSFRTQKSNDPSRAVDLITNSTAREADVFSADIDGQSIVIEPGRIGGDEFAALCHTDAVGTEVIARRIRNLFQGAINEELKKIGVDISIGINTLETGMTASDFLATADKRLYEDKKAHFLDQMKGISDEDNAVIEALISDLHRRGIPLRNVVKYAEYFATNQPK